MTHIVVIEDEPAIQRVIHKALTKVGGFTVTVAEDVGYVLHLARSRQVALVIMDVSLSNSPYQGQLIDGLAFTRLLKNDPVTCDIPVLLATAHALPGDAERLLSLSNADDYIAKPFARPGVLVEKVRQMLGTRRPAAPRL